MWITKKTKLKSLGCKLLKTIYNYETFSNLIWVILLSKLEVNLVSLEY